MERKETPGNDHLLRVYDSILGLLSSEENPTPLVRLHRVVPFKHTQVYAKLEWYNPFGAVKDRVAANLVRDAEEKGLLGPGKHLVEPTSGNTGLGLAMIANTRGYTVRTPLSRKIPVEKRAVLRVFGCEVVELDDNLCPAPGAPEGAIALAKATAEREPGFHMLNQYENEANPDAHFRTTGPEVWRQTGGKVTHFFAGMGTCGTITGTGRYLKSRNKDVRVWGVHPAEGHDIPGVRSIRQLAQTKLFHPEEYDGMVEVHDEEAYRMAIRLNREESVMAGPSSALALCGALKKVEDAPGNVVVIIFPDNMFKYASSMMRHFPDMFPRDPEDAGAERGPSEDEQFLAQLLGHAANRHNTVEIDDVTRMLGSAERPVLVDVRAPEVFASAHVQGAVNVPLERLAERGTALPEDRKTPIVTVCNVGQMSVTGLMMLRALGYERVHSMNGGTVGWLQRGLPVERGG
ncbi:MAG: pyridoxal-phosphate dependent enzyme [Deltaproteobacteria bacterium]|nr:pyridoxal-phosphate dependent enzyme [Deltaproteobacteria bacterium]